MVGGLRSLGLLAVAVAAHACLFVRAHNPFGSLAQASVLPRGAGLHTWPSSLPLTGLSRTLGAISSDLGRSSISEIGAEPQKQQMLKSSGALIEQARFAEAKAVLATCVELSHRVPQEVQAQVELLRWRMGLPQLGSQQVAAWLGHMGASQKPLENGLLADASLGRAFSRLARVVAGSASTQRDAAITVAVGSASTEAAFFVTDPVDFATPAHVLHAHHVSMLSESLPPEFAGACLHAILGFATCASVCVLIARVWAVGLSNLPPWQTPLVSMAAQDPLQRFWRILNDSRVCVALKSIMMTALALWKNLSGRLQKRAPPHQECLPIEPRELALEGGPSTCMDTYRNIENAENMPLKSSEASSLERFRDEASSTLVQMYLPEVPDESLSDSEMPELEQMGLEGLEREDFEDGLQDAFSECSESNVDGYGTAVPDDSIKAVLLSPDKLGFEACTDVDDANVPSAAHVEETLDAKKESLLCGSAGFGTQGSVRRIWGRRLDQALDSKEQPELSEAFLFASDDCLSEAPSEAPQDAPEPSVTLPRCSQSDTCFLESVDKSDHAVAVQIRALAQEAFGKGEDAMQLRRSERVAALLISGEVVSYASYSVRRDLGSFSVSKLAVAQSHRRRGLGRIMLRSLIQMSKRRARGEAPLDVVCLSSLPTSVAFYKACAFHESKIRPSYAEHVVEGQVYMEYCLQRKRNK